MEVSQFGKDVVFWTSYSSFLSLHTITINLFFSLFPILCHSLTRECNRSLAGFLITRWNRAVCYLCDSANQCCKEQNCRINQKVKKKREQEQKIGVYRENELSIFVSPLCLLCLVSEGADRTSFFYRIFSSLWRTDVINASIPLSGELCLLFRFTSLRLMMCVSGGGWGGLVGGWKERWEMVGWGVKDKKERRGRGNKNGWRGTREGRGRWTDEKRGEVRERIESVWGGKKGNGGKDKLRTGGEQNDLHTTPSPEKKRRRRKERIAFPHRSAREPFINYSL